MTYSAFLAQFNAVGSEKAQGYFPIQFEGMSPPEQGQARTMMLERALAGDTVDLDGLRLIGDADTAARLAAADSLAAQFGVRWDSVRRETLLALTGNAQVLVGCFGWLDAPDPAVREIAAEMLARLALSSDFADPIAARLLDGQHEDIVLPLSVAWLATQGIAASSPANFSRHLPFIRSIMSADPVRRREVLARGE